MYCIHEDINYLKLQAILNGKSSLSQCLLPRLRVRVEIRSFSQTTNTVSSPGFCIVICCAMPGRPVIPDGHVVAVPFEPDLGVVILRDELGYRSALYRIKSWR